MGSGAEELRALSSIISEAVESIADDTPSLHDTTRHPPLTSAAAQTVLAAAKQLIATVEGSLYVHNSALQGYNAACLQVAVKAHVTETIAEKETTPGAGLHVTEIAKSSTIDPKKLARVLRLLASLHIFREVSPDVFTNTSTSAALGTGKTVKELMSTKNFFDKPEAATAAMMGVLAEDLGHTGSAFADTLLSEWSHSYTPTTCNWQKAYKTDEHFWAHYQANPPVLARCSSAMRFTDSDLGNITKGFDFRQLRDGAKIVDVGSGIGGVSKILAKTHPHLKLVLQDQIEVIEGAARAVWQTEEPEAISSGRVKLNVHDFFKSQPEKDADVFILRHIVHNWPEEECIVILKHLSDAATPETRLILLEQLAESLAPLPGTNSDIPGAVVVGKLPYPLVHMNADWPYRFDIMMLCCLNAEERSVRAFADLGAKAGWKLEHVHPGAVSNQLVFRAQK